MMRDSAASEFNWSSLGQVNPLALAPARNLAHHALQWASLAARANLPAASDDSHSSLAWNSQFQALLCSALGGTDEKVQLGLQIDAPALLAIRDAALLEAFSLQGRSADDAVNWIDALLRSHNLKPVAGIKPPYQLPDHPLAHGGVFETGTHAKALQELTRWFAAGEALLNATAKSLSKINPGPGAVRCWPHHFDIAILVRLDSRAGESARSVGIGLSPGDAYYPQPYFYVSPWPYPSQEGLPALPAPGHWHGKDFFGAVAPADALLACHDRGAAAREFVALAFETCRMRLGA